MIRIRYGTDDKTHSLAVVGHAGYNDQGKDIVCAGVSAIIYALLGWLENNRDKVSFIRTGVESGEVLVALEGGQEAKTVFEVATIGLEQIAAKYPDHVAVEYMSR